MRSTLAHLYIITSRVLTIYNIIFDTQDITIYCSAPFFPLSLSALGKPKAFSAKRFQLYFIVSRPRHATAGFTFRYVFLVYAPLRSHVLLTNTLYTCVSRFQTAYIRQMRVFVKSGIFCTQAPFTFLLRS